MWCCASSKLCYDSSCCHWYQYKKGVLCLYQPNIKDTTTELPPERWDMDAYYDADVDAPGRGPILPISVSDVTNNSSSESTQDNKHVRQRQQPPSTTVTTKSSEECC